MSQTQDYSKKFFVDPEGKLRLDKIDPGYSDKHLAEKDAKEATENYCAKLTRQQALLYAEKKHSVLIVLQALDAGGKDGTVNHVFSALNAQGAKVVGFKQPTPIELAHDFLWRVHPHTPAVGEVAIFNRSHYEDVIVTRVHKLIDKETCVERYKHIREFEKLLVSRGTLILKFFLHISKDEQLARFAQRLEDPKRNWKISESDYAERPLWNDYTTAFEDALAATSTKQAPWFVIPANHKWFRNLVISQIMVEALEELKLAFPPPSVDLAEIRRKYHAAVEAGHKGGKG
jgi:PPK2 family polyphosphate:nucleotide phosphotransferase